MNKIQQRILMMISLDQEVSSLLFVSSSSLSHSLSLCVGVVVYLHIEDEDLNPDPSQHSSQQSQDSITEDPLGQNNLEMEASVDELDVDVTDQKSHQKNLGIHRNFNLLKNLEKIHCERYAEALIKEGFGDEVSVMDHSFHLPHPIPQSSVGSIFISH